MDDPDGRERVGEADQACRGQQRSGRHHHHVRTAQAAANGDDEQRELNLFASLAEMGVRDLEGLSLKDYSRLQAGYFRLVRDDEL